MKRFILALCALLTLACAMPASAASLLYTVTGSNGFSGTFTIDTRPLVGLSPFDYDLSQQEEGFSTSAPGVFSDTGNAAGVSFYTDAIGGGLDIVTNYLVTEGSDRDFLGAITTLQLVSDGTALFTGPITDPTLLAFGPTVFRDYTGIDPTEYTITAAAAVPESATWAMMLIGFGMVGAGMRRRRAPALAHG